MKRLPWLVLAAGLLLLPLVAAQEAQRPKTASATAQAKAEQIDFERARQLMQRRNRGEKLSAEDEAYLNRAIAVRKMRQRQPGKGRPVGRPEIAQVEKTGFKPLTEMTADDRYKEPDGGR